MALATVFSRARHGLDAPLVSVEVHLANGLPGLSLVGLPEAAVRESKDRVKAAIINSGFSFPARRITVNLAPADLPKDGGRFDLAIAIGILAAAGEIATDPLKQYEFLGELSLSGHLRPIIGALPAALACAKHNRQLIIPVDNGGEAALSSDNETLTADHLLSVCAHLAQRDPLPPAEQVSYLPVETDHPDLRDVRGQHQAKRALEVAAAGGHHLLFVGPPGSGKSMLASRFAGLLPPLSEPQALEVAAIQSISQGAVDLKAWKRRPFRQPHHTASAIALAGGGGIPQPGEISLAHHGVLFLDELPEFSRHALEVLREPMESGVITISRAARQAEYPARFQLIAAMNPCPCGWWGDANGRCSCTREQMLRYAAKISGPLLDRIDLQLYVKPVAAEQISVTHGHAPSEGSEQIRQRVTLARQRQLERQGKANAALLPAELAGHIQLTAPALDVVDQAMQRLQLSARAYHRILKVARSIADLADRETVDTQHIGEALQYRQMDRNLRSAG